MALLYTSNPNANLSNVLGMSWGLRNLENITENESALVLGSLVSAHAMLELREWRARVERARVLLMLVQTSS